jgi:hypothetical protein
MDKQEINTQGSNIPNPPITNTPPTMSVSTPDVSLQKITDNSVVTKSDISLSVIAIMVIIALFNTLILFNTVKTKKHPKNPMFVFHEMLKQSTLLYLATQTFGIVRLTEILPFLQKYEYVAFPLFVASIIYILNVIMGYSQVSQCKSKKRALVYGLAFIPALFVVFAYYFVTSFDWTMSPFNNLLGGEKTIWSYWVAIGFLLACVIWPTVSFVYFFIQRHACFESSDISINVPIQKEVKTQDQENDTDISENKP